MSVCSSPHEPSDADENIQHEPHEDPPNAEGSAPGDVAVEGVGVRDAGNETDCPPLMNVEDEDSESSSGESDALSSDHSDVAEPPARVKRFRARIPKEESWYVHSKSHLIHRFDGTRHNSVRFLVCGKILTDAYALCTEATAWNTLCRSCNRR